MENDLTRSLLAALSPDARVRTEAEANLRRFQDENRPFFLLLLSWELANEQKTVESRMMAGILLKNSLDAKDAARKDLLIKQWIAIPIDIGSRIKSALLWTLASHAPEARHIAAQVIAKIASIDIPRKKWPELIGSLLKSMSQQDTGCMTKHAALETLEYVCEEISHHDLEQDEVNFILTAVVHSMNPVEHSAEVRLAATRALCNALYFAETNFGKEVERNYIMKVVSDTALSKEAEIREAAFECLLSIGSLYYHVMEPYMQTLFELTSTAIRGSDEVVALQAIGFWSTICDEELERQDFNSPRSENFEPPHSRFIEKALPSLVPLLLETLMKQEEDEDHSEWSISMAGRTCLGLIAVAVGDAIVPHVMPFVKANIKRPDWQHREVAIYALGSILEGPTIEKLYPMVQAGIDLLLNAMKDESNLVRDTTAWTLSRIFEFLHSPARGFSVISPENVRAVLTVLLESIKDVPNVAEKVCGAICNLAQGSANTGASSSVLSPYITEIIKHLLATADREDVSDSKLRSSAYEALTEAVRCSNITETSNIISELLLVIMNKLGQSLQLQILSSDDQEKQGDLQASLCGILRVIIQKLGGIDETKPIIMQNVDQIMMLFLKVLACHTSMMREETILAVGALAFATGPEFEKYMPDLYRYLEMGLQNYEEYQICAITTGVVSGIFVALGSKMLPYCDQIMNLLFKILGNNKLDWSVKPPVFSCIGGISLAIGTHFEKYVASALRSMEAASKISAQIDTTSEELLNHANKLRCSIFEAYSGILQGFKDAGSNVLLPYAPNLLEFVEFVYRDGQMDESVTKAAITVIGDLANALGPNAKQLFKHFTFCAEFISECVGSNDEQLKKIAVWTQLTIGQAMAT